MATKVVLMLYNLAIADLSIVTGALCKFKKANWKVLGRELGLDEVVLEDVAADYKQEGVGECLVEMLKHWLRMNYDEDDVKPPTWSNLANAVKKAGDPALAGAIRGQHPSELHFLHLGFLPHHAIQCLFDSRIILFL